MCHKTIISFTPCGHTWPVVLPCGENEEQCDPLTEVASPEEALPSAEHCPECETDEIMKEFKIAVAKNPDFGKPEKKLPREVDEESAILEELRQAMEINPAVRVDHKPGDKEKNEAGLDPVEEYVQYLKQHPEHIAVTPTSRRDPNAPKLFYKYKEYFGCGHFGNFSMTEIERNDTDEEWMTTPNKWHCPNCNELTDTELMNPAYRMNDDPWRQGRHLGHVPAAIRFHEDGPTKAYAGPGMDSGGGSGYDRYEDFAPPKAPVLPGYEEILAPSVNPHGAEDPLNGAFAERESQQIRGKGKGRADAEDIDTSGPHHDERVEEPLSDEEYHGKGKGRAREAHDNHRWQQEYDARHYHSDNRSESEDYIDDHRSNGYESSDTGAEVGFAHDDHNPGDYDRGRHQSYNDPRHHRRQAQDIVEVGAPRYCTSRGYERGRRLSHNSSHPWYGWDTQSLADDDAEPHHAGQGHDEYHNPHADHFYRPALPQQHYRDVEDPPADNKMGDSNDGIDNGDRARRSRSLSPEPVDGTPEVEPPTFKKGSLKELTSQLTAQRPPPPRPPPPVKMDLSSFSAEQQMRIEQRQQMEARLAMQQARSGAIPEVPGVGKPTGPPGEG